MTNPTSAIGFSPDPVMREAEIRAMKEQVSGMMATATSLEREYTRNWCSTSREVALRIRVRDLRASADSLQSRLDVLMEGSNESR